MKKVIFSTIFALCGVVFTANAEEITEVAPKLETEAVPEQVTEEVVAPELETEAVPEQVIEVVAPEQIVTTLEVPEQVTEEVEDMLNEPSSVQDAISVDPMVTTDTVYVRNPADIEYSLGLLSSRYTYQSFIEENATRKWTIKAHVGNDVRPVVVLSRNREGGYLAPIFNMSFFDNTVSVGGGLEGGYMRKYWGIAVGFSYSKGYPDKTSDDTDPFTQLDAWGRLFFPGVEFKLSAKGDIFRITPYIEGNWKKTKFIKYDGAGSYTYTTETDEEYVITTVTTDGKLDARPHVWGYAAGLRFEYHPWGKIWYGFVNADAGRSQRFTYVRNQWHTQIKVEAGIAFNLYPNTKKNIEACKYAGYDPAEIHF